MEDVKLQTYYSTQPIWRWLRATRGKRCAGSTASGRRTATAGFPFVQALHGDATRHDVALRRPPPAARRQPPAASRPLPARRPPPAALSLPLGHAAGPTPRRAVLMELTRGRARGRVMLKPGSPRLSARPTDRPRRAGLPFVSEGVFSGKTRGKYYIDSARAGRVWRSTGPDCAMRCDPWHRGYGRDLWSVQSSIDAWLVVITPPPPSPLAARPAPSTDDHRLSFAGLVHDFIYDRRR